MDEFDVPSWDMDAKTEAIVDNIFSNMAILSAKKDKLSKQITGSDAVQTKNKKRKGTSTKAAARPNDLEQTAGNEGSKTKIEKRKRKKRKASAKPNDSIADQSACAEANLSAVSDAGKPDEGAVLGSEVSQKKKRKKKKPSCKKNKYAHLGRKSLSENLCTIDPSAMKNLKTCTEPLIGATPDKNISMTNCDKSGKNEKQMFPEKSGANIVDISVKSPGKKRKFCEVESREESLSMINCGERDEEGGKVKKRKISNRDEGKSKLSKNQLVKEGGLKKKQKIPVVSDEVQNAAEVEINSVKKQQASNAVADLEKPVKTGSVKKIQISENKGGIQKPKQKKKIKKKNDKDLSSDVVREEKSFSEKITPHKKDCLRKLPFNIDKLRAVLAASKTPSQPKEVAKSKSKVRNAADNSDSVEKKDQKEKAEPSLRESMMARLSAARFRLINEELYTSTSKDAVELFRSDRDAFKIYHEGYQSQVAKWPTVPVEKMVQYIKSRSSGLVVADFGCGDAKIAKSVPNKVHSFDLVALNKHVIVCDMKRVPLSKASVDIAVFCLSLMGTNLVEFLCEANRVLKSGGILLIAEVVSRFDKISVFVKKLQKLGFTLVVKDQSNTMFVWFEFKKTGQPSNAAKLPSIELDPCIYKKR